MYPQNISVEGNRGTALLSSDSDAKRPMADLAERMEKVVSGLQYEIGVLENIVGRALRPEVPSQKKENTGVEALPLSAIESWVIRITVEIDSCTQRIKDIGDRCVL